MPSLSLVTPCLNAEATLRQALSSVREQLAGLQVQHLLIDGGRPTEAWRSSARRSALGARRSAPGVRSISEPDRGLSDAMKKGIRMATGDIVGWLNADDLYRPGALARLVTAVTDRPAARWLTRPCEIVDRDGHETRRAVTAYKPCC
jgi:glycosyltransferase involved in cell wall biosynthesis